MAKKESVTRKFGGGGYEGYLTYHPTYGFTITAAKEGGRMSFFLDALATAATNAVQVATLKSALGSGAVSGDSDAEAEESEGDSN